MFKCDLLQCNNIINVSKEEGLTFAEREEFQNKIISLVHLKCCHQIYFLLRSQFSPLCIFKKLLNLKVTRIDKVSYSD